jgi:putative ABC transport system permease protein
MTSVSSTLERILTGVALLSTLVGGVVIMSLMTIGVSERRKEIGLRRAVGASRGDILFQFLAEAILISALGGLTGAALGLGGANAAAVWQKLPLIVSAGSLSRSVGLAVAIGLAFGIYPAWKASLVDPVTALGA